MKEYKTRTSKALFTAIFLVSLAGLTFATDGYFMHGYGTQSKGMGGVGIAYSTSVMGAAVNPAHLSSLDKQFVVGVALFSPKREYTVTGNPSGFPGTFPLAPGTVESDNSLFLVPHVGANFRLNDKSALGFLIYGQGGMNTEYPTKTFNNPEAPVTEPTGVNLSQMFISVNYAYQLHENHALGLSGIVGYQMFEATGLQAFGGFSQDPTKLSDNGTDNSLGFGFRLGYLGQLTEALSIGLSYQSTIYMGEFEDYAGLFAEDGDFDIPSNWSAGLAYRVSDKLVLAFDVKQIMYSEVNSVANKFNPMTLSPVTPDGSPNPFFAPLGSETGSGFGWEDMMVFKLGGEYMASDDFTVRAGFSYGEQPIESTEVMFNILAPGVIENHATIGFSKKIGKNALHFAGTYAFSNTVSGPNQFEAPGQQTFDLTMDQFDIEIGFSF